MKKWLIAVLLVVACVFGLTACGSSAGSEAPAELELTEDQRQQWYDSASQFVLAMNDAVQNGTAQEQMDDPVYGPAFSGWENALRDIGEVQDIVGKSCSFTKKEGTVTVTVRGSRHDADVVFTNRAPVDAATIARCPNLKLISSFGTGYNQIDLEAARARGARIYQLPVWERYREERD